MPNPKQIEQEDVDMGSPNKATMKNKIQLFVKGPPSCLMVPPNRMVVMDDKSSIGKEMIEHLHGFQ